jgi:hypothetical protein
MKNKGINADAVLMIIASRLCRLLYYLHSMRNGKPLCAPQDNTVFDFCCRNHDNDIAFAYRRGFQHGAKKASVRPLLIFAVVLILAFSVPPRARPATFRSGRFPFRA